MATQFASRYRAELSVTEDVRGELRARCMRHENGARMLDASLDGELLPPLSLAVLQRLAAGEPFAEARLDWSGEAFTVDLR